MAKSKKKRGKGEAKDRQTKSKDKNKRKEILIYALSGILIFGVLAFALGMIQFFISDDGEGFINEMQSKKDFGAVIDKMKDKELVLLGESTHGTNEFYEIRRKISKELIEDHGFDFIAVEGDWESIYKLNKYVKGLSNKNSAKDVMQEFDRWPEWLWSNEEIEKLAEWLKEYNSNLAEDEKVGFYGMDVYGGENSLEAVEEILQNPVYECLSAVSDDFTQYPVYLAQRNEPCNEEAIGVYEAISSLDGLKEQIGEEKYFYLEQNALVVKNAERHLMAQVVPQLSSWNERVEHMKETITRLLEKYDGKGIVWAHNTHVGDASETEMANEGRVNIGQLVREEEIENFILGFGTYTGEVVAGSSWGSEKEVMQIPKANENSYEALLNYLNKDKILLLMDAKKIPDEFRKINNHRAIGVVYNPLHEYPGNYVETNLTGRYDGFIYLRETEALI